MNTKRQKLITALGEKTKLMHATAQANLGNFGSDYARYQQSISVMANCSRMRPKAKTHGIIEGQPGQLWATEADSVSWLKNIRDCGDIARLNCNMWATDDTDYNTCIGIVGQLRTKDGLRYVTGYRYSDWDSVQWDLDDRYDNAVDAAINADRWACRIAESCREEDAKERAEQAREYAKEELERVKKELFNLLIDAETKTLNRQAKSVQNAIKREIERLKGYAEQLKEEAMPC